MRDSVLVELKTGWVQSVDPCCSWLSAWMWAVRGMRVVVVLVRRKGTAGVFPRAHDYVKAAL